MESDLAATVVMVKGKLLEQHSLYVPQTLLLLRQALQHAEATASTTAEERGGSSPSLSSSAQTPRKSRYADSSSEGEKEDNDETSASETSTSDEGGETSGKTSEQSERSTSLVEEHQYNEQETTATLINEKKKGKPSRSTKKQKIPKNQRERQQTVKRYLESLSCFVIPLPKLPFANAANTVLELPTSLLSKADRREENNLQSLRSFLSLATALQEQEKTVLVFALRSGRFAAAVYSISKSSGSSSSSSPPFQCLQHTTSTRYTVRKGQGKAQSAQDAQRRPKSIGSQLRRAGEEQLKEDVAQCLQQWKHYLKSAAVIFISCPKTMNKTMFPGDDDDDDDGHDGKDSATLLKRKDPRIRRVPLDIGRPSFEAIGIIHDVLTTIAVREEVIGAVSDVSSLGLDRADALIKTKPVTAEMAATTRTTTPAPSDLAKKVLAETAGLVIDDDSAAEILPLTAMHIAAQNGDFTNVQELVQKRPDLSVNSQAGPCFMTPLHYATQSTEATHDKSSGGDNGDTDKVVDVELAAEIVYYLLTTARADPCVLDSRSRPPYFLASAPAVRDAFRRARATLGEDHCAWDDQAKVGPALSDADLQLRKEKEAEKKRKKKQRQKEKKAQEKAQTAAEEEKEKEMQEKARQEIDAKRIRDGLQPKAATTTGSNNICDFCQTVCKGRRRNEMLQRLEYVYCSTDCVQKHKRELMAAAALSRFEK